MQVPTTAPSRTMLSALLNLAALQPCICNATSPAICHSAQVAHKCSAAGAEAVEVATVDLLDDNAVDTVCAQLLKARRDSAD